MDIEEKFEQLLIATEDHELINAYADIKKFIGGTLINANKAIDILEKEVKQLKKPPSLPPGRTIRVPIITNHGPIGTKKNKKSHLPLPEPGRINAYVCPKGHTTVTIDCEEGTTPFMIECPKCKKLAKSQMYTVEQTLEPSYEWYKPVGYDGLTDIDLDHVKKGGLLLRKIKK